MSFRTFVTDSRAAMLAANAKLTPLKIPWKGGSQVCHTHAIPDLAPDAPLHTAASRVRLVSHGLVQHMVHMQADEQNFLTMQQDFLRARKDEAAMQAQLKQ
jgi:hypothetical protein